jgi:hypothetical protein
MAPVERAEDTTDRSRWRLGRIATLVAIAGLVALWTYVLYLAIGPGRRDPPDTLDDPAFGQAAEVRCQAALDEVAALPPASASRGPLERAEVIDEATAAFDDMVADLRGLTPAGDDGELVTLWIADWETYLEDRREHADALRRGEDRRFRVTARDNEQITKYIDAFAADNDMPACGSPLDV